MKLVDNARHAWKMASVRVASLGVIWGSLSEATQTSILTWIGVPQSAVPAVLGLAFVVARLVAQPSTHV